MGNSVLEIYLKNQKAYLRKDSTVYGDYQISSSKHGIGFESNSNKTPTGRFKVFKKIGENEPIYSLFKERKTKEIWDQKQTEFDLILSRIIWIDGIEDLNKNTKDRLIYLHGTNQENLIGIPSSHGCIRFKNKDIIELFNLIEENTEIIIYP